MNITIYSGSFNPIHKGHVALATFMLENKLADEVWFVVTPSNPLKNIPDLIDHVQRLAMVNLITNDQEKFKASDIEFDMPVPSYTIDTLRKLSSLFPQHEFSLLIGSDNASVFDQWKSYPEIMNDYKVFVYPRKGDDPDLINEKFPKLHFIPAPYLNISSTEIREKIRKHQDCTQWLKPEVLNYIQNHNLYK